MVYKSIGFYNIFLITVILFCNKIDTLVKVQGSVNGNIYEICTEEDGEGKAAFVTIFQYHNFTGWPQCLAFDDDDECYSLNTWWREDRGKVSSVDSHGTCIQLYAGYDCSGPSRVISVETRFSGYLEKMGFNDETQSISSCKRNSSFLSKTDRYEKCSQNDCRGKTACGTIYQHRNLKVFRKCLTFQNDNCTKLSNMWNSDYGRASSVDTHGTCIRFYEFENCTGLVLESGLGSLNSNDLMLEKVDKWVRSVSSCERSLDTSLCYIGVHEPLFSRYIDTKAVSDLNRQIFDVVLEVGSMGYNLLAIYTPGVNVIYQGIQLVIKLFDPDVSTGVLIEAKIEEAFARNSAIQISGKMKAITNRLNSIFSNSTLPVDRKIDVVVALHTCEEVKNLFEDNSYSFSKNKTVASPYLVTFSSVYMVVAKLAYEMRPELRPKIATEMMELTNLNKRYMKGAIYQRKDFFLRPKIYRNNDFQKKTCDYMIHNSIDKEISKFFWLLINQLQESGLYDKRLYRREKLNR